MKVFLLVYSSVRMENPSRRRSNKTASQNDRAGKAFNILGYGFGGLLILIWILIGLGMVTYGTQLLIRRAPKTDYHVVEATRIDGGDYIYDDPLTGNGMDYETDPSKPAKLTLYIHKESGRVTELEPGSDRTLGVMLVAIGVGLIAFAFFVWYLLRVSPTFRRIFGGVALLDAIF